MRECRDGGALDEAIRNILGPLGTRRAAGTGAALAFIRKVADLDYRVLVRTHFDRAQLTEMYLDIRRTLPSLNREVQRVTDVDQLAKIAKGLGAVLQRKPLREPEGTGLRGFYVYDRQVLKQPLIWVNTASHPIAVAAAFWHEVGHHLTARMWGVQQATSSLYFPNDGPEHFADAREIAADMVRVLAGYPKRSALRVFGEANTEVLGEHVDQLVSAAIPHMRKAMGFDFQRRFSARENLYYLGGIIHVAKLRTTLLTEYGI